MFIETSGLLLDAVLADLLAVESVQQAPGPVSPGAQPEPELKDQSHVCTTGEPWREEKTFPTSLYRGKEEAPELRGLFPGSMSSELHLDEENRSQSASNFSQSLPSIGEIDERIEQQDKLLISDLISV